MMERFESNQIITLSLLWVMVMITSMLPQYLRRGVEEHQDLRDETSIEYVLCFFPLQVSQVVSGCLMLWNRRYMILIIFMIIIVMMMM